MKKIKADVGDIIMVNRHVNSVIAEVLDITSYHAPATGKLKQYYMLRTLFETIRYNKDECIYIEIESSTITIIKKYEKYTKLSKLMNSIYKKELHNKNVEIKNDKR